MRLRVPARCARASRQWHRSDAALNREDASGQNATRRIQWAPLVVVRMTAARRRPILFVLGLVILLAPTLATRLGTPSSEELERRRVVPIGSLRTAAGTKVDVYGVWGDVFDPREARSDLGFDLSVLSLYFDPLVETSDQLILAGNPTLWSAISRSLNTDDELQYLSRNLVGALAESRRAVICFLGNVPRGCEGDQIVPYIWPVLQGSELSRNRVKYLAAAPLFDPIILANKMSPNEARVRLSENTKIVVQRILNRAASELDNSVSSVAFAALGSTSHRGGDSPYFLLFDEGFRQILQGVEDAHPSGTLSRIYLVAYHRHTGDFKTEALKALENAATNLRARTIVGEHGIAVGGLVTALFFCFGVAAYRGAGRIVESQNRWDFVGKVLGPASALGAAVWGATVAFAQATKNFEFHLGVTYFGLAAMAIVAILWLSKRTS